MNDARILVHIDGETKGLDKATGQASNKLNKFKSIAKGVAGATAAVGAAASATAKAFWNGANATAQYGDQIDKTSQKVGLSTDSYQKWDYAMNIAGTSMQNCAMGLKTMTNKLDDAKNGSSSAQKMFTELGISMDELKGKSREEVFGKVVEGLQNVEDGAKKAALANDFFGRSGQELMPLLNDTAENTKKIMQEAEDYGMVMSNDAVKASAAFQDSLTKLQGTFGGVKNRLMGEFLPGLTTVMDGFSDLIAGVDGAEDKIKQGVESLVGAVGKIMPKIVQAITKMAPIILKAVGDIVIQIAQALVANLPELLKGITDMILGVIEQLAPLLPEIVNSLLQGLILIMQALAEAMPDIIPVLIEAILDIIPVLIENLPLFIKAGIQLILGLAEGILKSIPKLIACIPKVVVALVKGFASLLGIHSPSTVFSDFGKNLILGLIKGIVGYYATLWKIVKKVAKSVIDAVKKIINPSALLNAGKNLVQGLWNGIKNAKDWVLGKIKGFGESILKGIKGIFGISSPSKVMFEIGGYLDKGFIKGIDSMKDQVEKSIDSTFSLNPNLVNSASAHYSPEFVNNTYVEVKQDPLGQVVNTIKTFQSGAKNDYNYGKA